MAFISDKGYKRLETSLKELEEEYKKLGVDKGEAALFGDVSESSEYIEAKVKQRQLESLINKLRGDAGRYRKVDISDMPKTTRVAGFGAIVTFKVDGIKESLTYQILDEYMVKDNPLVYIDQFGILGQTFTDMKVGDKTLIKQPRGVVLIEIVGIEYGRYLGDQKKNPRRRKLTKLKQKRASKKTTRRRKRRA